MTRLGLARAVAIAVVLSTAAATSVLAQSITPQQNELRQRVERRFDVLVLRNGIALRPKAATGRLHSIEMSDGAIAIDGVPATADELRARLGADADLVMPLWYLDDRTRQRMFESVGIAPRTPEAPEAPVPPAPPEPPAAPEPPEAPERPRLHRGGDQVQFGGSVFVAEGEVVTGDAVAIGGSVTVNGEVTGNAVAVGGSLDLGPHAFVHGDVVTIGGTLNRAPGARVFGKEVRVGPGDFNFGGFRAHRFPFGRPFHFPIFGFGPRGGAFALAATLARLLVLCVLASLVLLVGREYAERVGDRAAAEPVKAGAIGLLAQLLFVPVLIVTVLVLVVTIIGIPLLVLVPFGLLALAVVALVGFTGVAYNVGRLVHRRLAWSERNPYMTVMTGILLLLSPILIARLVGISGGILFPITGALVVLGFLLEYVAWTIGFGAVALQRFARPIATAPPMPPPLPPVMASPTSM